MDKVTYTYDLSSILSDIPKDQRQDALNDVGSYLVEAILSDVGEARSPVTGRMFKRLSKDYAEFKSGESSNPIANLELSGDMLDALTYKIKGAKIEVGIWGEEAPKADGHCNHSGDSSLPERVFIPKDGQKFRPEIRDEVVSIIEGYLPND